jgi:hypothetical protein
LEKKANYYKLIEARDKWVGAESILVSRSNNNVKELYKILSNDKEVSKVISLETEKMTKFYYEWNQKELKEEDKQKELEFDKLYIKTKYGNIKEVDGDLKTELPYSLSSRYQKYKPTTIITKIKEKIQSELSESISKNKLEKAKTELMNEFSEKYPLAKISYDQSWVSSPYVKGGYYSDILKIEFPNTSWVKIVFHHDKSFHIKEKHDHRVVGMTKEEIIDYLAS